MARPAFEGAAVNGSRVIPRPITLGQVLSSAHFLTRAASEACACKYLSINQFDPGRGLARNLSWRTGTQPRECSR